MTAVVCLFCFSIVFPFSNVSNISQHSSSFWTGALGIGCIGTGIAYLFWNRGVQITGANKAGVFVNLVPLSAGLSASLFGENMYSYHFISGIAIISGLIIMQVQFSVSNQKLR
jgi:drug/metabolite transporter (DMT)-like permease